MIRVDRLDAAQIGAIVSDETPSFSGIVAGECKGDIWVNDLEQPTLAVVYSSAVGGFCTLGRPEEQETYLRFRAFLD
ncbi:hypothetical protein [Paenibacillus guangzhouensis]|uniref:hypothetical protein n=1 Tax=Paenibacillus guangzhouensis TaxID=1473112 RepID=UPI0012673E2D|nr:hypothetical protein [Paenibacillus guangzhouensis]